MCKVELGHSGARPSGFPTRKAQQDKGEWCSLFSLIIVLCPFSHISLSNATSFYVLVQDVSILIGNYHLTSERSIDRRKELNDYKWAYKTVKLEPDWKKTRNNLSWMARNLQANNNVEFLIEHLQPSLIDSVRLYHRYKLSFGMSLGSIFWFLDTSSYMFMNEWVHKHINWSVNKLIIELISYLIYVLITGLIYTSIGELKNKVLNGLIVSLFTGLTYGMIVGFAVGGGKACLQHLSLRIVLWQSGLPWNFARFLNYCVERRLLLRVGGSYRFLHRELLDHFAQSSR